MKLRLSPLFVLAAIATLSCNSVLAADPSAKLTKVSIRFDTPASNDNKDHDTKVSVSVKNKINLFLSQDLAELINFAGDTEFKDPSSHTFDLPLKSDSLVLKDITLPVILIRIAPNGNDRWIFSYTVTLTFSDGTVLSSTSKTNVILDQNNTTHEGVFSG
jgi:hypothetical protein